MGFLDDFTGSLSSPSTAFNFGAAAAAKKFPAAANTYGWQPEDAGKFQGFAEQWQAEKDREYTLKKRSIDREYEVALKNARTQADVAKANKWYNEQQVAIARDRLQFDRDSFAQTHALNQAKLGYDVMNMAANLRGPENYFQAANFARGVANDPNSSTFLSALKSNVKLPDFGAQYGVPDPETLSTLSSKLGTQLGGGMGSSMAGGGGTDTYLNNIRGLYAAGAHRLGAGALENLTDTERKLLVSGIDAVGGDAATFMDQYRRSRVGQGLKNAAAA